MKSINVLLAVVVSLLVFVGVFELGLRVIGMGPTQTLNEFDPSIGWVKKANTELSRSTPEFDVTYTLNEHGFRDDPGQSLGKPEGTRRVLALGDSFTLGYSVEREDLFVDHLEKWWHAEDRKLEVINSGTEGYSTDQAVAWLMLNGAQWKPDLVLLFAYENDIFYNGQDRYLKFPKPRFDENGKLKILELENPGPRPRTAIGQLFAKKVKPLVIQPGSAKKPFLREFGPLLNEAPEDLTASIAGTVGALKALRTACDQLSTEVALVIIPSHSAVDEEYAKSFSENVLGLPRDAWDPNRPAQIFRDAAEIANIPVLDATEELRSAQAKSKETPLYFERDFHLTPDGNRALAQFVHGALSEQGLAPGQGTILAAMPEMPGPKPSPWPGWLPYFLGLWAIIGSLYGAYYKDENLVAGFLKVGALLAVIFTIALGAGHLLSTLPPQQARLGLILGLLVLFGFIFYKLGDRLGTITELCGAFIKRGHWYLMPLVMILLSVGSLLVVAASSPLVAPFIYTLF